MTSDQELNEAVARKLGWTKCGGHGLPGWHRSKQDAKACNKEFQSYHKPVPDYCHSIQAAFEIVEFLRKTNTDMQVVYHPPHGDKEFWTCNLQAQNYDASAVTAPRAISLAFLKLP